MTPQQRLEKEKQAMAELQAEQQKFASAAALASADPAGGLNEAAAKYYEIQQQIESSKLEQLKLQKQISDADERASKATDRRTLGTEFGPGTADAAAGGFRVDAADFARQQAEEAAKAMASVAPGGMTGSFGASQLQRIGFASNEFFDTRRKEDPTKVMERMLSEQKKTNQILGAGEPLVLPASN
jgi:hypothetical protein